MFSYGNIEIIKEISVKKKCYIIIQQYVIHMGSENRIK